MEKEFEQLEQCFEANDVHKAYETLNYMNSLFPPINPEEIYHYIVYASVYQQNIALMKLIYHPLFSGDYFNQESIQTLIAREVVEQEKFDFIATAILSGMSSMKDYTFEVINYNNLALCEYILTHPPLDFDYLYLKEIYKNLFYQEGNEVAYLLKDKVNMDSDMVQQCFKEALTLSTSLNIQYLVNQYPSETFSMMANWFYYIQNDNNHFEFDSQNLFYNEDYMGSLSLDTIIYVVDLFEQQNNRELNEKEDFLMTKYFLSPFMTRGNERMDAIFQLLNHNYNQKGKNVPESIFEYVETYHNKQEKDPFPFSHFKINYEKYQLEQAMQNTSLGKKIKL